MTKDFPGEKWKTMKFDFDYTNEGRIEVSNIGRIRSFNKISDGNIVNGSMINGYRILRLKLYKPRDEKTQKKFDDLQQQAINLARKTRKLKDSNAKPKEIAESDSVLAAFKKELSKKYQKDLKKRTINYHSLIHRLVAHYFLKEPATHQTIVAHLDYDKLNNRSTNLKWMSPEENYEHQKHSPHVIKEKRERQHRPKQNSRATKLTVTKVMLLKKLLREEKPMKQLVKLFKVTETQILRIKRGENWPEIEAAK